MNNIIIKERPDNISWEDIRQTLVEAHKNNIEGGLVVRSTTLSADQLREQVGDGKCYVAIDGTKIIGVAAVRIKPCNQWFCHSHVAHFFLDSVLTKYQGKGIYSLLQKQRYAFVEEQNVNIITTNTAANNKLMIRLLPRHGFRRGLMFRVPGINHFSITWVKWLHGEPSTIKRWLLYEASVAKTKLRYLVHKMSR